MRSQLIIRLDNDLKVKVSKVARSESKTTSQVVIELLQNYVEERDIEGFIDGFWNRIGEKLNSREIDVKDVDRVISDVRAGNP